MFTVESSAVIKKAQRLYAQMGTGNLKEAVELARKQVRRSLGHPHKSAGLVTIDHTVCIAPRCPVTKALLWPGVPRKRVVVYSRDSHHVNSVCHEEYDAS